MNGGWIESIRSLADRVGVGAPLARAAEAVLRLAVPARREHHQALTADFAACAERLRRISAGAPPGDPAKPALFVSSFATAFGRKLEGALSLAARLAGFSPVILEMTEDAWGPRYHDLFASPRLVSLRPFLARAARPPLTAEMEGMFRDRPTIPDLLRVAYRSVDVGRIALSNWLNAHKFTRFDLSDPSVATELQGQLLACQRAVHAADALLDKVRPAVVLILEKGVSPAAEIVGAALARGIPVVQYCGSQITGAYVLKRYRYEYRHQHPFSLSPESWAYAQTMPWGTEREASLMREFADSYQSGTWFDRKYLHQGKRLQPAEQVRRQLGLDPTKKTAIVFSHVLWDATFFYGDGLFDDYETWLLQTVRAAVANPRLNWIVKLHPDLVWKLRYEGHRGELRDVIAMRAAVGTLPDHVKVVLPDTDISTYSFFAVADFCLTVRGTVGIEMACQGVPVITAGTGRYSGLGFTLDSASPLEYRRRLETLEKTPGLTPEQREMARRFAFTLFKLRPWKMRTFEMVKRSMDQVGHPLDTDLAPNVDRFEEFAASPDTGRLVEFLGSDVVDYLDSDP